MKKDSFHKTSLGVTSTQAHLAGILEIISNTLFFQTKIPLPGQALSPMHAYIPPIPPQHPPIHHPPPVPPQQQSLQKQVPSKGKSKGNFCTGCGTKLEENSTFCVKCGKKV